MDDMQPTDGGLPVARSLPKSLGFMLRRIQLAYNRQFQQFAAGIDMPTNQLGALAVICRNPDITPGELASVLTLDATQLTPIMKQLELRGLVKRRKSASDSRSHRLWATGLGEERYRQFKVTITEFEAMFVGQALQEDEAQQLLDLLVRLESAARARG